LQNNSHPIRSEKQGEPAGNKTSVITTSPISLLRPPRLHVWFLPDYMALYPRKQLFSASMFVRVNAKEELRYCSKTGSSLLHPLSIFLSIYGSIAFRWTLARFFNSEILYTVGRTPWTGDKLVPRPLPTHRTRQIQNKRRQTSMP
jgi:hypothetical protein